MATLIKDIPKERLAQINQLLRNWDEKYTLSVGPTGAYYTGPGGEMASVDNVYNLPDPIFRAYSILRDLDERECECGSEKAGIPGHSGWCPKFSGNRN